MTTAMIAIAFIALLFVCGAVKISMSVIKEPDAVELTAPEVEPLSDEQKVAKAFRAKLALEEFLAPAINQIGGEYLTALTTIAANEPWETGKMTKLAIAQRVIKAVEQQIILAVMDGEQAGHNLDRARAIAAMPEAKRRWLNGV